MVAEGSGAAQAEVGIEGDEALIKGAVVKGVEGDAIPGVEAVCFGSVLGSFSLDKPSPPFGGPDYGGRDFAHGNGCWLVDDWARHVAGLVTTPIFDLTNENDRSIVERLHGPRSNWSEVELNSTDADG